MGTARSPEPIIGIEHGVTGYRKHGCGCYRCKDAHANEMADYRDTRRGGRPPQNAGARQAPAKHGTRSMHKKCTAGPDGGKCEACKDANRRYQAEYARMRRSGLPMNDPHIDTALKR